MQPLESKTPVIRPADRLAAVSEYYFSRKGKEIARLNAAGQDIISLAIGSPDMPPSPETVETLCREARRDDAHGYQPTAGTPELRRAMSGFYKRWYGVELDPDSEIQPLIGSKEGILHVTLAFVNPGERVLVPNPGYPTYTSLSRLLGCEVVHYDLRPELGWQPDFDQLESMDGRTSGTDLIYLENGNHGGFSTALYIDPVLTYAGSQTSNESIAAASPVRLISERSTHTLRLIFSERDAHATYTLFDISGKVIDRRNVREEQTTFTYPQASAGFYIAHILYKGKTYTYKVRL